MNKTKEHISDKILLDTIFNTNPDSITITNLKSGKILDVNDSFSRLTGFSKKESIGKTAFELDVWVNLSERKELIELLSKNNSVTNFEVTFRNKNKIQRTGLVSSSIINYDNQKCLCLIVKDITHLKNIIDRSITNELRFKTFFTNDNNGITILDLDYKIKSANTKFSNMLGFTSQDLIGTNIKQITYIKDLKQNIDKLDKILSGEIHSFKLEKRYLRKDNTYFWGNVFAYGIYNKNGELKEILEIQNDITKEKYEQYLSLISNNLSNLDMIGKDSDFICKSILNFLSTIFTVGSLEIAKINDNNTISYFYSPLEIRKKKYNIKNTSLIIKYICKTSKSVNLSHNEIPKFFKRISNEKKILKATHFCASPITINSKIKYVLIIKHFEKVINFSHSQNKLIKNTASLISAALEKNEAINNIKRLSLAVEQSPSMVVITDRNLNVQFVNKSFTNVSGYTKKEIIGKNASILKSKETTKKQIRTILHSIYNGKIWKGELKNIAKNGKKYWIKATISPIKNNKGEIINFLSSEEDITKLKEVRIDAEKFNLLVNTSQDFIAYSDLNKKLIYLNPGGRKLVGLSKNFDVTKLSIEDFHTKEEISKVIKQQMNALKKRGVWNKKSNLKHFKTGKSIPVLNNSFLLRDPATGKPILIGTIQHDLSAINNAINVLKESELKFKTLSEGSQNLIFLSKGTRTLYVNKAFCKVLGFNKEEILSPKFNHLKNIIAEESKADVLKATELHSKNIEIPPYELKLQTKKGKKLDFINSTKLIEYGGKQVVMGILTDITKMKKVEKEIITAKEKAEELSRLKSSFYANMSHELRTPLVGILGAAEIIKDNIENNELKELATIIFKSGFRLTKTLNYILDISKINSEKMLLNLTPSNLDELIFERVTLFRKPAEEKNLYLKYSPYKQKIIFNCDADRIIEIIDNLINNAIKFTDKGGITISTSITKKKNKNWILIKFKDTGIGISPNDKVVIFDEYRQASEGLNRSYEGTGLGLTITKKYVELMKGKISVTSKLNVGSTFKIELPYN